MPPKKDNKKQAVARPDNSGIPKQDVQFKFNFVIESDSQQSPNYAVMFQWFGSTSQKLERIQTPIIDSWQKGDKKYTFEKVCDLIRVDDDFCKTLTTKKFYIYFVNVDDNKVQDQILLDYSSLLMGKGQSEQNVSYESNTVKIISIDNFKITLTADKQLLKQVYRHYLNPFLVQIIGALDVPLDTQSKYQPAYVKYQFFDGNVVTTNSVVGNGKLIWTHKHVFLSGLMDPTLLKQKIRSKYMKFELHDRDQINNTKIKQDIELFDISKAIAEEMQKQKPVQQDPKKKGAKKQEKKEAPKKDTKKDTKKKDVKLGQPILPAKIQTFKNNYGIAAFYLVDFIKPSMKTSKYKAPVVPRNTFEDFQSRNIDLNTTARNQMQKIISTNNYFQLDTLLVVGFTLSYPIGTFIKPQIKQQVIEDQKKGKKDSKAPQIIPPKQVENKQEPKEKIKQDVFERVLYIIPYKDQQTINKIQQYFYSINLKTFSLANRRELTTYLLKQQQKKNKSMDYLTGLEIIDADQRIYFIQGLCQGAMKGLNDRMQKSAPNTKTFKILKNSSLTFLARLYADFNLDIKRIRLRPSLSQILLDPNIYIKSKVAEQICQNLNKINDIKKLCDDLKAVDSMNLWPASEWLIQIQRKYSQSLSYEDINGCQSPKQKKFGATTTNLDKSKPIKFLQNAQLTLLQTQQIYLPKINTTLKPQLTGDQFNNSSKLKVNTKTFVKDFSKSIETYNKHLKKAQIPDNQPVYIYAGQKNNWYQKQMREMRQKIQNDPKNIYTYSNGYLSLSIDPKTLQQQAKNQKQLSKSKNFSNKQFSSLIIKTKQERMKLPKKPSDEDIQQLKRYPYHEDKTLLQQMTKNTRDLPLNSSKQQFKKYIRKNQFFSQPQIVEGQRITPLQRFRLQQQQRKKQQQQFKQKLKGDPVIRTKKGAIGDKASGTDRFKDIRQGEAKKLGIIDIHKKDKVKRPVQQYEVSLFLQQDKIDPSFNPLVRIDNPSLNTHQLQFNNYQTPQVLTYTKVTKPLKNS